MPQPPNLLRFLSVFAGLALLAVGLGFARNLALVTQTWPWPDGSLSHLFVGSVLAAIAVALIWIGCTAEWGALAAGALTALVMTTGQAGYLFLLARQPHRAGLLPAAGRFALVALASLGLLLWSRRFPIRDARPMPWLLRLSYALFVLLLVLVGSALLRHAAIFPWSVAPDSSVMFGWIFLADACYYCSSLLKPRWHNARSQLLSFLAYDLVLIPPFLGLFARPTTNVTSLIIYLLVLFYSAGVAVYYLFFDPVTRPWAVQEEGRRHEGGAGTRPPLSGQSATMPG